MLTLHRNCFRLRKLLERRIYEIAREVYGAAGNRAGSFSGFLRQSGKRHYRVKVMPTSAIASPGAGP